VTCATCHGTGKFPDLTSVCGVCKGRGALPDTRLNNRPCPVCHGTGKFPGLSDVCPTCDGWGKLPAQASSEVSTRSLRPMESGLVQALEAVLPSAAASYRQAVFDLRDLSRESMRGTAVELREALREVLDHLAPDDDVMKMAGFKLEPEWKRPTMRQKARFVLQSRRLPETAARAPEDAAAVVDGLVAALVRSVYQSGSLTTHVASARADVEKLKMYVDTVLAELLDIHRAPNNRLQPPAGKRGG
jgi:predicted pPIWI-associating nuclease